MMNSTQGEQPTSKPGKSQRKGVLCAKCEHLNPPGTGTCSKCGAHLFVTCVDCGERNERVRSRCNECGRKLHRHIWDRFRRRLVGRGLSFNPTAFLLFILGVAVVFGLIVVFSHINIPSVW